MSGATPPLRNIYITPWSAKEQVAFSVSPICAERAVSNISSAQYRTNVYNAFRSPDPCICLNVSVTRQSRPAVRSASNLRKLKITLNVQIVLDCTLSSLVLVKASRRQQHNLVRLMFRVRRELHFVGIALTDGWFAANDIWHRAWRGQSCD